MYQPMTVATFGGISLALVLMLAAPASRALAAPERAAAAKDAVGAPVGEWQVGAVNDDKGKFSYCVTESRYDNGRNLVIGRNAAGELNIAIGMHEGNLTVGASWQVVLKVDDRLSRQRRAAAASKALLVIANGRDEDLFAALGTGHVLSLEGPADSVAFQLKGTGKTLRALKKCAEEQGQGAARAQAGPAQAPMPQALATILKLAGLEQVQAISLAGMPPAERPADVAWSLGPVFGGMLESSVSDGRALPALSEAYVKTLKVRCAGAFESKFEPVENLPTAALRTAVATCSDDKGRVHVSLLLYLTRSKLFTVFFHEAAAENKAEADRARDAIAAVIRKLAAKPAQ
ncbi:MAG: hypothetical protein GC191_21120 [Azospirillum sp.]|nr:hypothetical protein [Azospirillum sp.]